MPALVVLAAGLGTRFGGVKQLAAVGPNGEAIVDVLLARAARSGFDRAHVVVRADIFDEVDRHLSELGVPLATTLAIQAEPRGTADAVLACGDSLDDSFAVVNADDLYPDTAFDALVEHLTATPEHALVAFRVDRTLIHDEPVSRARIEIIDDRLAGITEETVSASSGGSHWVSMNMWGFRTSALDDMARAVEVRSADEVLLPDVVGGMIRRGELVRVLKCDESCIGITYAEDVEIVRARLQ